MKLLKISDIFQNSIGLFCPVYVLQNDLCWNNSKERLIYSFNCFVNENNYEIFSDIVTIAINEK